MKSHRRHLVCVLLFLAPHAALVAAQNPTLSLKAKSVNDVLIPGGPVSELSARPLDIITVEVFARDWSPDGETLRAFQAQMDDPSYNSGSGGWIKPVDYDELQETQTENKQNAFLDRDDPRYIFTGAQNITLVDSIAAGYRFAGVLVSGDDVRLSTQDGTMYYCGTLRMAVSEDARGTFTIRLNSDEGSSSMRAPQNKRIIPMDFEDLTIHVLDRTLRIVSSDPPDHAINARCAASGEAARWNRIEITFDGDASVLTPADFEVQDGSVKPPAVRDVRATGSLATLQFDGTLNPRYWTAIIHKPSHTRITIASLPGDVNGDGRTDGNDLVALVDGIGHGQADPIYRFDLDGDGRSNVQDALRMLDVLSVPTAFRARLH